VTLTPGSITAPGMDTWILNEDNALKAWLKGLTVWDQNLNPRPVPVWFGQPDPEIRTQSYPYITLDLLDLDEDKTRMMTRYGELAYAPPLFPASDADVMVKSMAPTPMNLIYQVSSWARTPRHDRSILSQMNFTYLHPRFAQVGVAYDNTSRRIEVQDFAKRDTVDEEKKRLFRNVWTIALKTEFFYFPLDLIAKVKTATINVGTLP
jgi:hypothetical protein